MLWINGFNMMLVFIFYGEPRIAWFTKEIKRLIRRIHLLLKVIVDFWYAPLRYALDPELA